MISMVVSLAAQQPQLVVQTGHQGWIASAAFRPDGKLVATGASDGRVKLWNPETGLLLLTIDCQGRPIGLAFTSDGQRLVTGQINGVIEVFDASNGRRLWSKDPYKHGGYCGIAVSADSKTVAGGGDRLCGVFRLDDQQEIRQFKGPQKDRFYALAFNPTDTHLALASDERCVYLWRLSDGKVERRLDSDEPDVLGVLFHRDDKHLISWVRKGVVRVWNWRTGEVQHRLGEGQASYVALSPDGQHVAIGRNDGQVVLFAFGSATRESSFAAHKGPVTALAFDATGEVLLTGGEDGGLHLWNRATGKKRRTLGGVQAEVPLAVSGRPDGAWVCVWDRQRLRVFDVVEGKTIWTSAAEVKQFPKVSFSPDGNHLAFGPRGKTVTVIHLATGKAGPRYAAAGITTNGALALGPEGKVLACRMADDKIDLWRAEQEQRAGTLPGRKYNDILSMSFSRDGTMLCQGGKGNYLRVLDVASGKARHELESGVGWVLSLALNQDGKRLLCGGPYSSVVLRSLPDFKAVHLMKGHRGSIRSVAFAADEQRLLSVGAEGLVRIWMAKTGKPLGKLRFLAGGQWILQATDGGLWDASPRADEQCQWSATSPALDKASGSSAVDPWATFPKSITVSESISGGTRRLATTGRCPAPPVESMSAWAITAPTMELPSTRSWPWQFEPSLPQDR